MTIEELLARMEKSPSWLAQEAGRSGLAVLSEERQAGVKSELRTKLEALASARGYGDGEQGFTPAEAQERFRLTPQNFPEGQDSRGALDLDEVPNRNEVGGEREAMRGVPARLWSDLAILAVT